MGTYPFCVEHFHADTHYFLPGVLRFDVLNMGSAQ